MSLADYLAKNYLTADPTTEKKKSKKRKRKGTEDTGLVIADDDANGWPTRTNNADDDFPTTGSVRSAELRKKSKWKTIGSAAPSNAEQAAADAIIAQTAAQTAAQRAAEEDEDAPVVANTEDTPMMESGARAGLQTAAQVTAAMEQKRKAERKAFEANSGAAPGETIYRDASGRIINVAMKRAEARKKQEAEERKKAEEAEAAKGDVQRAQKEERGKQLQEAKYLTVARYADDKELNDELKQKERWNDPAAGFLEKKREGRSVTGKPLYKGSAAPNRYGILPGHWWDGVDRSTGFEKEWFASRNRRQNMRDLEYAWQMDE